MLTPQPVGTRALLTLQAGRQEQPPCRAVCSPLGQHSREENPKNIKPADMLQLRHTHCFAAKGCSYKRPAVPRGLHDVNKWSGLAHLGLCDLRRQILGELYQQELSMCQFSNCNHERQRTVVMVGALEPKIQQ